jgi:NhaP-type Na+/H+ or K+/H+ antiporter
MLPVGAALAGVRFRSDTKLVMGWFGPRGLASVVFGLLAVEELAAAQLEVDLLAGIVTWTILFSVLAHGLSAEPIAKWYARRLSAAGDLVPESKDVPEIASRHSLAMGQRNDAPTAGQP